jgi:hypothetical protein
MVRSEDDDGWSVGSGAEVGSVKFDLAFGESG